MPNKNNVNESVTRGHTYHLVRQCVAGATSQTPAEKDKLLVPTSRRERQRACCVVCGVWWLVGVWYVCVVRVVLVGVWSVCGVRCVVVCGIRLVCGGVWWLCGDCVWVVGGCMGM